MLLRYRHRSKRPVLHMRRRATIRRPGAECAEHRSEVVVSRRTIRAQTDQAGAMDLTTLLMIALVSLLVVAPLMALAIGLLLSLRWPH